MYKVELKNKDSVIVIPESGKRLGANGKIIKTVNTFWKNRERDGDVTITDMSKKQEEKKGK